MNNSLVCYDVSSGSDSDPEDAVPEVITIKEEPQDDAFDALELDFAVRCVLERLLTSVCGRTEPTRSDFREVTKLSEPSDSDEGAWDTASEASTSTTSMLDDDDDEDRLFARIVHAHKLDGKKKRPPRMLKSNIPRLRGEILTHELPPIENLSISLAPEETIIPLGKVMSVVDSLVVVTALPGIPALNEDSFVFTTSRECIGKVFEVFGCVTSPMYSILLDEAHASQLPEPGTLIYFAPKRDDCTRTVFTDALLHMKGTDASWEENSETPFEYQDFSDDEKEKQARVKARHRTKPRGGAARGTAKRSRGNHVNGAQAQTSSYQPITAHHWYQQPMRGRAGAQCNRFRYNPGDMRMEQPYFGPVPRPSLPMFRPPAPMGPPPQPDWFYAHPGPPPPYYNNYPQPHYGSVFETPPPPPPPPS